jgi:DNA repair protein SbcC/Rad50
MLGKLFGGDKPQESSPPPQAKEVKPVIDRAPWEARLAQAAGDDAALLALAIESPLVDIKVSAVAGIGGEAALKEAEHAFRDHHRRAHREAKQRLERAQWIRKSREKADAVIAEAEVLRAQPEVAANKLVELDRGWSALDQTALETNQVERYAEHWQALSKGMRARGDLLVQTSRWAASVQSVMAAAKRAAREVAAGTADVPTLDLTRSALAQCIADAPPGDAAMDDSDLLATAMAALANLSALADRAAFLDALKANPAGEIDEAAWLALPEIGEAALAKAAQDRFNDLKREARERGESERREGEQAAQSEQKALDAARRDKLKALIVDAEAKLAEGHVQDAIALVKRIDGTLAGHVADKKLAGKVQHLHGEIARLNKWKQWGGGRAREDLLAEAKALETAAAQPKLQLKTHAEAIDKLRERWKELDKLGAAGSKDMWTAFDTALKTAFLPVDAFQQKLKSQREENLAKRNALVGELDAYALPAEPAEGEARIAPDFKAIARLIDHIDGEWRKLGPIEHTVPRAAKDALLKKLAAAKARLETPLTDARRVEALRREKLIAAARAIDPKARDAITKTRELQGEWQAHAKTLPLAREVENGLWRQFKEATDALFKTRDAEFKARDNEFSAQRKAREELIGRLRDLGTQHTPEEIRKTIGETDAAWRKAGEPARADAARLESAFRAAKDAAKKLLEGSATREWNSLVDALLAKLQLVRDIEAGTRMKSDDEWQAMRALPTVWEAALKDRHSGKTQSADSLLILKLEDALDLPSPPAQANARRDLKLRAMKAAMEARVAVTIGDKDIAAWVAELLRDAGQGGDERVRLDKVFDALRRRALRLA